MISHPLSLLFILSSASLALDWLRPLRPPVSRASAPVSRCIAFQSTPVSSQSRSIAFSMPRAPNMSEVHERKESPVSGSVKFPNFTSRPFASSRQCFLSSQLHSACDGQLSLLSQSSSPVSSRKQTTSPRSFVGFGSSRGMTSLIMISVCLPPFVLFGCPDAVLFGVAPWSVSFPKLSTIRSAPAPFYDCPQP